MLLPYTDFSSLSNPLTIAMDLGSNTLRIVVLACHTGTIVYRDERIVGTADGLSVSGEISPAAVLRVVSAVKVLLQPFAEKPTFFRAVTTEAMRRASNAETVLDQIAEETGIYFEVIGGKEEAWLTLQAVMHRLQILGRETENFVLVDIGGGSTELSVKLGDQVLSQSFPLGIVTLTQEAGSVKALDKILAEKILPLQAFWDAIVAKYGETDLFVATAGTPTTVAAMKLGMSYAGYDSERINGTVLERNDLSIQQERLLHMNAEERRAAVGEGRETLIVTGLKIFDALYALLDKTEAIVIDDGLREGVALDLCKEISD